MSKLSDKINTDHSHRTGKKFLCQRTGRYVPADNPICQVPDKACKYRIDCIIYALQEDERVTIQNMWRKLTVDKEQIEKEIDTLEEKIEKLRASKPAHDVTGAYDMELLGFEDELQAKKKRLQ